MRLLTEWVLEHRGVERRIQLFSGDLSSIPLDEAVDVLIVSAFRNDYYPTDESLIGALYRRGVSVYDLSEDKERDMREEFACWISRRVEGKGFGRILCIESGWRGTPLAITDDVFRALVPLANEEFPDGTVAMPLIGTGNQGYPAEEMIASILQAAVFWFRRGLNLGALKIVSYSDETAAVAKKAFENAQRADALIVSGRTDTGKVAEDGAYDVFMSYSHKDADAAQAIVEQLRQERPRIRIFHDRNTLSSGESWLMRIAESLDTSIVVAALYTPDYWASKNCKDEFSAAFLRQNDTGEPVLFPLYYRTAQIPYMFRSLHMADCREGDEERLRDACTLLCRRLEQTAGLG